MKKFIYIAAILIVGFATFAFSTVKNQDLKPVVAEQSADQNNSIKSVPHTRTILISEE